MRMKLSLLHRGSDQGLLVCQGGGSLLHNQAHLGGAKEDRRPSRGLTPRSTCETIMVLPDQDQFILTARWYSLPGWCAIPATPATARAKRNAAELRIFAGSITRPASTSQQFRVWQFSLVCGDEGCRVTRGIEGVVCETNQGGLRVFRESASSYWRSRATTGSSAEIPRSPFEIHQVTARRNE